MNPEYESIDSRPEGEHNIQRGGKIRRLLGAFLTRSFIQGDGVLVSNVCDKNIEDQAGAALSEALEEEYPQAISRAQSLLVAVSETRLPAFLENDAALRSADPGHIQVAIQRWVELTVIPLERLRLNTEACAYLRDDIAESDRLDFCAQVGRAEEGLRLSLYRKFSAES